MPVQIPMQWLPGGSFVVAALGAIAAQTLPAEEPVSPPPRVIGQTAKVTEETSRLEFLARVDTGAAVSSIDCGEGDLVIERPADDPRKNIGKPAKIRLDNREGGEAWIEAKIDGYVEVRNAERSEHRYRVRLPLSVQGVRKQAIVNLNDRSRMTFGLLLGRDYLEGDFLVDVSRRR